MKNKKRLLWIVIALIIICLVLTITLILTGAWFFRKDTSNIASSQKQASLSLNTFFPIQGTSIYIANIEEKREVYSYLTSRWFERPPKKFRGNYDNRHRNSPTVEDL